MLNIVQFKLHYACAIVTIIAMKAFSYECTELVMMTLMMYSLQWLHENEIPLTSSFSNVRFVLWDEDKHSKDDVVGDVVFSLASLSDNAEHDQWCPV